MWPKGSSMQIDVEQNISYSPLFLYNISLSSFEIFDKIEMNMILYVKNEYKLRNCLNFRSIRIMI